MEWFLPQSNDTPALPSNPTGTLFLTFGGSFPPQLACLMLSSRILVALSLLLTAGAGRAALAQAVPTPKASYFEASQLKSFYGTYRYTAYTVYDLTSDEPPTPVRGVGGTLTLGADGRYQKRLTIQLNQGPMAFNQDGQFTIKGDSIRFAFTDAKGHDVQRGTFRFDPQTQALEITIIGYPSGNKGVYALQGGAVAPAKSAGK